MRVAFLDVMLDDCYGLGFLPRRQIRSILDIGGSVGFFTLAARNAFPDAVIHVYEPNPAVLDFLHAHLSSANCEVFAEAVGVKDGHVGLVEHLDFVQVQVRADLGTIPRVAFGRAIERMGGHCDLVKLDCEGAEWEILKDVDSWRNVDHLSMEYHLWHENHRHEDVGKLIAEMGFVIRRQTPAHKNCGIVWASRA
jgi:FkbM family methyltransferase